MTAARILLWRHGRTEWNVVDRFQGQADVPLDGVGYGQAVRAAEVLAAYRPTGLYSSDLSRCYQTAALLAERTGLEIITDKRLREIHVGSWEGLLGNEIRAADPELARRLGLDAEGAAVGESAQPFGDRGRGQPDPSAELGDPEPGVAVQLRDDAPVDVVERSESMRTVVSLFRRHLARSSAVWPFIWGMPPS